MSGVPEESNRRRRPASVSILQGTYTHKKKDGVEYTTRRSLSEAYRTSPGKTHGHDRRKYKEDSNHT